MGDETIQDSKLFLPPKDEVLPKDTIKEALDSSVTEVPASPAPSKLSHSSSSTLVAAAAKSTSPVIVSATLDESLPYYAHEPASPPVPVYRTTADHYLPTPPCSFPKSYASANFTSANAALSPSHTLQPTFPSANCHSATASYHSGMPPTFFSAVCPLCGYRAPIPPPTPYSNPSVFAPTSLHPSTVVYPSRIPIQTPPWFAWSTSQGYHAYAPSPRAYPIGPSYSNETQQHQYARLLDASIPVPGRSGTINGNSWDLAENTLPPMAMAPYPYPPANPTGCNRVHSYVPPRPCPGCGSLKWFYGKPL